MDLSDDILRAMSIPDRNAVLDRLAEEAADEAEARAEWEAERRAELWWENGGPHADVIAWEHEQDRLRYPFDPIYARG